MIDFLKKNFLQLFLVLPLISCGGGNGGGVTPETPVLPTGVTLNSTSLTLEIGKTSQLIATVSPTNADDKSVTWTSSNSNVASVNSGLVTAIGTGNATITVTTNVATKSATCKVTVIKESVAVTDISLNLSSKTLYVNENVELHATIAPSDATNKKVVWASDNSQVAKVVSSDNSGNATIKALKAGTAIISATSDDNPAISDECEIIVENKDVTGIELSKSSINFDEGDKETLTATILPSDATIQTVTWSVADPTIVSLSPSSNTKSVQITALKEGSTTITAKSDDNSSIVENCSVVVNKKIIPVTSVNLNQSEMELKIGKNSYLTATILPSNATYKDLEWSVDNNSIASIEISVNNTVLVSGLKEGTTVVRVKSKTYPTIGSTCQVTVKPIPVTSINLDSHKLKISNGSTEVLTATVLPSDATDKSLVWSCDKSGYVSVTANGGSFSLKALKSGIVVITISSVSNPSIFDKCTIEIPSEGGGGGTENTEEEPWK